MKKPPPESFSIIDLEASRQTKLDESPCSTKSKTIKVLRRRDSFREEPIKCCPCLEMREGLYLSPCTIVVTCYYFWSSFLAC